MLVGISKQYPETTLILMPFKVLNTVSCARMAFEAVVVPEFIATAISMLWVRTVMGYIWKVDP